MYFLFQMCFCCGLLVHSLFLPHAGLFAPVATTAVCPHPPLSALRRLLPSLLVLTRGTDWPSCEGVPAEPVAGAGLVWA